jgi:hypothetical protein
MVRKRPTKPRKRASQARSRATVDALIEATARILVKQGFDKASTNRHTAVLHRSDMLGDAAVGTLVDEATRLVVGYLQVGAVRAVSPRIPDRTTRRAADES